MWKRSREHNEALICCHSKLTLSPLFPHFLIKLDFSCVNFSNVLRSGETWRAKSFFVKNVSEIHIYVYKQLPFTVRHVWRWWEPFCWENFPVIDHVVECLMICTEMDVGRIEFAPASTWKFDKRRNAAARDVTPCYSNFVISRRWGANEQENRDLYVNRSDDIDGNFLWQASSPVNPLHEVSYLENCSEKLSALNFSIKIRCGSANGALSFCDSCPAGISLSLNN